jgi:hypothetical protein
MARLRELHGSPLHLDEKLQANRALWAAALMGRCDAMSQSPTRS